jgi:hypothetical protein
MNCTRCNQLISPERLAAVPDATLCVVCLQAAGGVPRKRGHVVFDHKTAGTIELVSGDELKKLQAAEQSVEERVSRL